MSSPERTAPPEVKMLPIDNDMAGQRVDNFLLSYFKSVPKSRIYRALRHGEVRVNKKRVKAEYRLLDGDILRIPPIRVQEVQAVVVADKLLEQLEIAIGNP